jgi:hypothetical protein
MAMTLSLIRGAVSHDGRNSGCGRPEPGRKRGRRVGWEVPCHENSQPSRICIPCDAHGLVAPSLLSRGRAREASPLDSSEGPLQTKVTKVTTR